MKTTGLNLLFLLLGTHFVTAQNKINLQVSNICEHYGQIIGCNGPDSSGAQPSIGNAGCPGNSFYVHHDSVGLANKIDFMNIDPGGAIGGQSKLLCIGDESKILIYNSVLTAPSICNVAITLPDSIILDSVVSCIPFNNEIYIIRNATQSPNLLIYQDPFQTPITSSTLNIKPRMFDVGYQYASIIGEDSSGDLRLNLFHLGTGLVTTDTPLPMMASNAVSIYSGTYPYVYIVSSPGDTAITITSFNYTTQVLLTTTIHSNSGLNTGDWEYGYFHYQPLYDLTGNNDDKKVFRYELNTMQPYATFNINKRLHKLIYPAGDFYYYMHAVEESALNNNVFVYYYYNYQEVDSFITPHPVDFIVSDFRCFVSVPEYDDRLVKMQVYPNPTAGMINIKASGLICGRDYKMDIVDLSGKIVYEKIIHAKMNVEISMQDFNSGIYGLRIHTMNGIITEKIVKEN